MAASQRSIDQLEAELSEAELAVRIIESTANAKRPAGRTPESLLAEMNIEASHAAVASARAAIRYFAEWLERDRARATFEHEALANPRLN